MLPGQVSPAGLEPSWGVGVKGGGGDASVAPRLPAVARGVALAPASARPPAAAAHSVPSWVAAAHPHRGAPVCGQPEIGRTTRAGLSGAGPGIREWERPWPSDPALSPGAVTPAPGGGARAEVARPAGRVPEVLERGGDSVGVPGACHTRPPGTPSQSTGDPGSSWDWDGAGGPAPRPAEPRARRDSRAACRRR